jgi:hypothetical protein
MTDIEILQTIKHLIKYPDIDDNEWILKEIEKLINNNKGKK